MFPQQNAAPARVLNRRARNNRLFSIIAFLKRNRVTGFLNSLNPFNWFNEFRDITISMEEFSSSKK